MVILFYRFRLTLNYQIMENFCSFLPYFFPFKSEPVLGPGLSILLCAGSHLGAGLTFCIAGFVVELIASALKLKQLAA